MDTTRNETVILALLAEKPSYGYEIESEIDARGLNRWAEVTFSSIYYLLNKLEASGLIDFVFQKHGRYPTRKVYHLTATGEQLLRERLCEMIGIYRPSTPPCIVGITFIHVLPKEAAIEALEKLTASIKAHLDCLGQLMEKVKREYPMPTVRELLHLGEIQSANSLSWVRNLTEILRGYDWERLSRELEELAEVKATNPTADL